MGRILAIDYGLKRVGLAVSDELKIIATPLETIANDKIWDYLKNYFSMNQVETVVVGVPINLNATTNHMTREVEIFIQKFEEKYPSVELKRIDERFTSKIAMQSMHLMNARKKDKKNKENLDKISATLILQTYMQNL